MHVVALLIVVFLHAQPATATTPAVPEQAVTKSAVVGNEAACDLAGQMLVSQLLQDPAVAHAGYACIATSNPEDKAV